jgi:hypothetical protein
MLIEQNANQGTLTVTCSLLGERKLSSKGSTYIVAQNEGVFQKVSGPDGREFLLKFLLLEKNPNYKAPSRKDQAREEMAFLINKAVREALANKITG